jgi:hypothetical protein
MQISLTIPDKLVAALGEGDHLLKISPEVRNLVLRFLANHARYGQELTGKPVSKWPELGVNLPENVATNSDIVTLTPALAELKATKARMGNETKPANKITMKVIVAARQEVSSRRRKPQEV